MYKVSNWFVRGSEPAGLFGRGLSPALRYAIAVGLVVLALLARLSLDPLLGPESHPYATFYIAVAVGGAWLGLGPALMLLILGLFASLLFVVPPRNSLAVRGPADVVEIALYLFVTGTVVTLMHYLQEARRQAARHARLAREKQAELEEDIVARHQAEEALRESEQRFRSLAEKLQDVVWISSPNLQQVLYVNPAYERVWGRSAADLYGDSLDWLGSIHPEDLPRLRELLDKGALSGPFEIEYRLLLPDGSLRWIRARGFPIEADGAKVVCAARIAEDITVRKEIEQARARNNEELERLVQERTVRLRETIAELEHFSYALVHDMRAPLRAMRSYTGILQEMYPVSAPEAQDFCHRIMTAAERLDLLICDSLNYTKVARAKLPLKPVDLGPLLQGLLDTYPNLQAHAPDIRLAGPLPVVFGNEAALTECFSNLLGNAVKFVAPGARPDVKLWAERHNGWVKINIQDHGIGIPRHSLPRLFGMFQRLTNEYEGTGIGLAIVRKAVERMGGTVGVDSELGKGSCFWVELRLAEPTPRFSRGTGGSSTAVPSQSEVHHLSA